MSWVNLAPSDIISTLNILSAAYTERYNYFWQKSEQPEILPRPSTTYAVKDFMRYFREKIRLLYEHHFPVKNFGRWGHWQPYWSEDYKVLDAAISDDLTAAGIDPGGILLTVPRRITDRTFVLGAYYLLNNILLYRVNYLGGQKVTLREEKWWTESNYDTNTPYVDEITEGGSDGGYGKAMEGYLKSTRYRESNRRFFQPDEGYGGARYPLLQGSWKGRYTTQISKLLRHPQEDGFEKREEVYDIPGVKEINFTGRESTIIPYLDDITSEVDYFRTWGNYKYGWAGLYQTDRLTEISLTPDNLPNPNYQYLD